MMTSVTLPSGAFPSTAAADDSAADVEPPPPRPAKRCLSASATASFAPSSPAITDSCKKRRKQATPVRISAEDAKDASVPSPDHAASPSQKCPICQLSTFTSIDELRAHVTTAHMKRESDLYADGGGGDAEEEEEEEEGQDNEDDGDREEDGESVETAAWMPSNKDWLNANLLTFPGANHLFMGLPPFAAPTEALPPRQPIRIFNPDAYCELCNKEFCNKYFLKTHKANKHGIYSEPPPPPPQPLPALANESMNTFTGCPIKVGSDCPPAIVKTEASQFASKLLTKLTNAPLSFVFNGGDNMEADLAAIESTPGDDRRLSPSPKSSPPISEHLMATSSHIKQEPGGQEGDMQLSGLSQVSLRRIGVMNPKAFCEICCKEYCNKYFLRTHKMKRHGLFIPDDKESSGRDSVAIAGHHIQTSPLNLIVGEQAANGGDRKTAASPSDVSCDACGIRFQNASLFQLHNASVHAKSEPAAGDSISEDLQKLQTMILQLNDLDVSRAGSCVCGACGKEFDNRHTLHAHTMADHGGLLDESERGEAPPGSGAASSSTWSCEVCGKECGNADDLRRHRQDAHKSSAEVVKEEGAVAAGAASGRPAERRSSTNVTPTSSYCEICNKELCNKYFMKTHMQRMHGIEIENGAQIGGVVCDICNKELCSKYFLRVHKHNTHGIVECGGGGGGGSGGGGTSGATNLLQPQRKAEEVAETPTPDSALKPGDLADLSHRYFTHFTEVCGLCGRRFRSTKWLKAHLLSDHGQAGADKWSELELQQFGAANRQAKSGSPTLRVPVSNDTAAQSGQRLHHQHHHQQQQKLGLQNVLSSIFGGADEPPTKSYSCSFCPFATPILPLLFVHERSHASAPGGSECSDAPPPPLKCPICSQAFAQPEALQHHVLSQHPLLPLPPFFHNGDDAETASKQVVVCSTRHQLPEDIGAQLKEAARTSQLPVAYALPQSADAAAAAPDTFPVSMAAAAALPAFVMQAFRVQEQRRDEDARRADDEDEAPSFMPSIVFLPVSQKLSAPITATFTLTPA